VILLLLLHLLAFSITLMSKDTGTIHEDETI